MMMEKSDSLSVAECMILMCYKAASPLTCIALFLSYIAISWIITLKDFYSFFCKLSQTILQLFSTARKCCTQVKPAAPTESTFKTCTKIENPRNDSLSREELEVIVQKLGIFLDPSKDNLKESIGSREISDLFYENEPSLEEVKEAFDLFDENGDGYVDAKELRKIIFNLGFLEASEDECQRMIRTFDHDGDGRINLSEFMKLMVDSFSS